MSLTDEETAKHLESPLTHAMLKQRLQHHLRIDNPELGRQMLEYIERELADDRWAAVHDLLREHRKAYQALASRE